MTLKSLNLRPAAPDDLEEVNRVIEAAVMTWDLTERVKRLSLPSYCYDVHDFEHLQLVVAEDPVRGIVGLAAWEPVDSRDVPDDQQGLLLHGIYVGPDAHRNGIGTRLVEAALEAAQTQGYDGLLVKAQPSAEAFFTACGFRRLPVRDPSRDYAHRFWHAV